jgi:hypothetical protein
MKGRQGRTAVALRRASYNHVDWTFLVSIETTAVCIPVYISEILLTAFYKSPDRAWIDADIIEVLSCRHKPVLAGDLNVKNCVWNSAVSEPSGETFFNYLAKIN